MAKPKRKTLPKDFEALLQAGDFAAITEALEACEPDARGGFGKRTALSFPCSDELSRWLVARGASVDAVDTYGQPPLQSRIAYGGSIEVLIELGADVNHVSRSLGTALHVAACANKTERIRTLLSVGARVDALNQRGMTALELALHRAHNGMLPALVDVARTLLDAGAERRPSAREAVQRIGETFEFHRAGFNRARVGEASAALHELYQLFDVPAVAARVVHDGVSPITVAAGPERAQHAELWKLLVPSKGAASTVQGEVIRIAGRVADEIHRNGGGNWDAAYRAMVKAFIAHVQTGEAMSDDDVAAIRGWASRRPSDEQADAMLGLSVRWVRANPTPVALTPPSYAR